MRVVLGFDCETDVGSWTPYYEGLVHGTPRVLDMLKRHGITATFYFTGDAANPSGVHLHFSIVLDDGKGGFRNELDINNTLDPSPYLGLPLNAGASDGELITCTGTGE